jgi:RNA polymerase sigma-70 factor, ECF subfamily
MSYGFEGLTDSSRTPAIVVRGPLDGDLQGEAPSDERAAAVNEAEPDVSARLRALVDAHHEFLWRSVRRLGAPTEQVDDAVQEIFFIAHRRLEDIEPGRERAFLFSVARNVTAELRRRAARARVRVDEGAIERAVSQAPGPEELLDEGRLRAQLDEVLDGLGEDARVVFVLIEIEGMSAPEVAALLDTPVGTVASRLRRGREQFRAVARRLRARTAFAGGHA